VTPVDPARSKDPARRAAADVLLAVDRDGAYVNLVLPRLLRERRIASNDAAFATELAYGAVRRSGVLDAVIEAGAKRPVTTLDPPVRAALRLGAYQLLHTRVAQHAAVSATVDIARELCGPKPTGLVNAVLRKVSQKTWPIWVDDLAPKDAVGRLAFDRGYPRWIAAALLDALGGDIDELSLALTDNRPVTHLVARPGQISRDELLEMAGPAATAGPWSPYAVHLSGGGDPGAIDAVRDGRAAVQDEGSQLVAVALAKQRLDGADRRWLDMCAGPGGKAALLGGLLPTDGRLVAADRAPHRATLVTQALRGTPNATVIAADGLRPPWPIETFDRVLVDAPCTGLGALRRRPDARWRRDPSSVVELQQLQRALLRTAVASTRIGGVVAYATCSPHLAETNDVIRSVAEGRDDIEILDARALLPGVSNVGPGPFIQLWPHRHGTDAMFVGVIRHTGTRIRRT
jgi:16S rRNA (cytosine967-C5)-methyltransferase